MGSFLGKLDPFGHLSARCLLHTWLTMLVCLGGLWCVAALFMGKWVDLAYFAAMLGALAAAALSSHPGVKLSLLAAWVGWWLFRFTQSSTPHLGVVLVVLMSLYVIARAAHAWWREGTATLRVGRRHPLVPTDEWPELAELFEPEKLLVLSRARGRLPRPKIFSTRFLVGLAALLAIQLLEVAFVPIPDSDSNPNTVELARSGLGALLILPFLIMVDPQAQTEPLRRALRDQILPEFWQQPWLWDHARRDAVKGRTV